MGCFPHRLSSSSLDDGAQVGDPEACRLAQLCVIVHSLSLRSGDQKTAVLGSPVLVSCSFISTRSRSIVSGCPVPRQSWQQLETVGFARMRRPIIWPFIPELAKHCFKWEVWPFKQLLQQRMGPACINFEKGQETS